MTRVRALNRDAAKQNPESVFESPIDIAEETLLTTGEKLATLERWRQNILDQLSATNDGMRTRGSGDAQLEFLEGIQEAKARLKERFQVAT
jgi:hypothetical protein